MTIMGRSIINCFLLLLLLLSIDQQPKISQFFFFLSNNNNNNGQKNVVVVFVGGTDPTTATSSGRSTSNNNNDVEGDDDGKIVVEIEEVVKSGEGEEDNEEGWSWDRILLRLPSSVEQQQQQQQQQPKIVANGNVWPPSPEESSNNDCLILVTRNQLMWHCPNLTNLTTNNNGTSVATDADDDADDDDDAYHDYDQDYERTIIFRHNGKARYMGIISIPGTDRRRLWILASTNKVKDELWELDTITGQILQTLIIDGSLDGHDIIRVDSSLFVVDTHNGHVIECQLPSSSEPYQESSIMEGGAKIPTIHGYVDIIKRHTGFTRADHINNIAIHPQLIISNLHGKGGLSIKTQQKESPTRLTALDRKISSKDGRELNMEQDGFQSIQNVGEMCHGIAFWKDDDDDEDNNVIKLISLDSKSGSLVSVVVVSSGRPNNYLEREVLWIPNENHPVLVPPKGIINAYHNGAKIFSKGLAVQNNIAYFGVSYARAPPLRQTVPESLLVAVDLKSRKELFVRPVRTNGLLNHVVTQSYLGWKIQLPTNEIPFEEITYHGSTKHVDVCNDIIIDNNNNNFCQQYEKNPKRCLLKKNTSMASSKNCCICNGGQRLKVPMMAGQLDEEAMEFSSFSNNSNEGKKVGDGDDDGDDGNNKMIIIAATVTFIRTNQCLNAANENDGITTTTTKHMNIINNISNYNDDTTTNKSSPPETTTIMTSDDISLKNVVKHICFIDVKPMQERFGLLLSQQQLEIDDGVGGIEKLFSPSNQLANGNSIITAAATTTTGSTAGGYYSSYYSASSSSSSISSIQLVFSHYNTSSSSNNKAIIYHFPWLNNWLPTLEEWILLPLGITLNKILHMEFVCISPPSSSADESDGDGYSKKTVVNFQPPRHRRVDNDNKLHHIHIPIITNSDDIFFLTELDDNNKILKGERKGKEEADSSSKAGMVRIKSHPGEVYEFNNKLKHSIWNLGGGGRRRRSRENNNNNSTSSSDNNCIYLILDWIEDDDPSSTLDGKPIHDVIMLEAGQKCRVNNDFDLDCDNGHRSSSRSSSKSDDTTPQDEREL